MPTIQQLVRKGRATLAKKSKSAALDSCPQREVYVQEYIQLHLRNLTLHLEK